MTKYEAAEDRMSGDTFWDRLRQWRHTIVGYRIGKIVVCGPCTPVLQDGCECSPDEKDENGVCQIGCVEEAEPITIGEVLLVGLYCDLCGDPLFRKRTI